MNKESNSSIYTREWVVSFMLDICGYKKEKNLSALKIIEPSCGDGSFILEIVSRLLASAKKHNVNIEFLKNNILAFETEKNAFNIVSERTMQLLIQNKVSTPVAQDLINHWFRNEDFILSDAHDFDIVIGNPPYIRATELKKSIRNTYVQTLDTFTLGTDIYVGFIEKGLKSINKNGKLCFICSDRWQKNQFGEKIRNYIASDDFHISFNCQMYDVDAFETKVTAYPSIFIIEKNQGYEVNITCSNEFNSDDVQDLVIDLENECSRSNKKFVIEKSSNKKVYSNMPTLEEADVLIGIGIATGKDKIFMTTEEGIVEAEQMIPLAYSKDIQDHKFSGKRWLISPWHNGKLVDLSQFPKLNEYFSRYKEELSTRYIAKKNSARWYSTIDKIRPGVLTSNKLLIRDMSLRPEPIFDKGTLYPHHNLYFLISEKWDLEVLGGILISDTIFEMMKSQSVEMRGKVIRNQAQYLRKIKVPHYNDISDDDKHGLKVAFRNYDYLKATKICERIYEKYE